METKILNVDKNTGIKVNGEVAYWLGNNFLTQCKFAGLPLFIDYKELIEFLAGVNARIMGMAKEQLSKEDYEAYCNTLKLVPVGIQKTLEDGHEVHKKGGLLSYQGGKVES